MTTTLRTRPELAAEARQFVESLEAKPREATLVTLSGELGAGKTAFVQEVARVLGVEETVTSPTFVLEKIYALSIGQSFARLIHIDAYRLERGADLTPLGFDELMKDTGNLILLEWPEKVADTLPSATVRITLATEADGSHTISYAR